jgi:hypothetical protein
MRSELVFGAMKYVANRYLLTRLAANATRKFHRPYSRIEETTSEVLVRFSQADPLGDEALVDRPAKHRLRRAA